MPLVSQRGMGRADESRFNMGGKLPGLRGGPDRRGCSGGNETDGTGCFSTRIMWRTEGAGEGDSITIRFQQNRAHVPQCTRTSRPHQAVSAPSRMSSAIRISGRRWAGEVSHLSPDNGK